MCAQPMSAVVLFAAQSEKNLIFQDAIMAEQVLMLSAWFGLLKHSKIIATSLRSLQER